MELTDAQWEVLKPLVEPKTPSKRPGWPRWEYHEANFLGLVRLGCILILMRRYL